MKISSKFAPGDLVTVMGLDDDHLFIVESIVVDRPFGLTYTVVAYDHMKRFTRVGEEELEFASDDLIRESDSYT